MHTRIEEESAMKHFVGSLFMGLLAAAFLIMDAQAQPAPQIQTSSPGKYKNFRVALYAVRDRVSRWSDPKALADDYEDMTHQVKFDKVYLEWATNHGMVNEAIIDPIKKFFTDRGIVVSGAVVTNKLSFANADDMKYLRTIGEISAKHFDELILDDWFFTDSKTAADIAAKGAKSWTQYRTEALDNAAANLLIKPAKAINPKFRLIIKYPNWYEHHQAMGYDLAVEPKIFDAIYTGVETRDPVSSEQHLQQYLSYNIVRYLENVKPGGNAGAWVDQLGTRYIDRYAEQIWDAAFAKPREITLWQWPGAASPINIGARPWENLDTSLNYKKMLATYQPPEGRAGQAMTGHVAGYALEQLDSFLGQLGNPIGIPAYRPPHAIGEEFLHDYLGMIGIPIDLHPDFPTTGSVCLLTEGTKYDPDLVQKIKGALAQGRNVVITSGLLRALSGKGIEDISEFEITPQRVGVNAFQGRGGRDITSSTMDAPVTYPVIHFVTNQSWGELNGLDTRAPQNAYPIILSDQYDRGTLYVLAIPDNVADLYRLPAPVLASIRSYVMGNFPVRLADAPSQVSLFAYDNRSFVVQSFLPAPVKVSVSIAGGVRALTDLVSGQTLTPRPLTNAFGGGRRGGSGGGRGRGAGAPGTAFAIDIPPHSYRAFRVQN